MEDIPHVKIERPIYDQKQLINDYKYEEEKPNFIKDTINSCNTFQSIDFIKDTIPVLKWMPSYKWKRDFSSDVVSGITVAIMHIPQGMAYALLGNVPAVVGIYMAFFPVLVYFFLGTSRHNSMGTFAVVCLMTGKVVLEHSDPMYLRTSLQTQNTILHPGDGHYSPIQVATAVTFVVAIFQLIMYIFRLGIVSTLLSETLVSGFTTGAAMHVLVSQLKDLLGLHLPKEKGYFVNLLTCRNIYINISEVNYAAIIISATTITIIVLNNEILKPKIAKICSFPIPIELVVVILGTVTSTIMNLHETYAIKNLGDIPSGLPAPSIPPFELMQSIWLDGLTIAIVSYTITLSMGLIFAQKLNYEVDANQELLAQGIGNIFGSFFSCMPVCASLSRSLIQQTVGGKTQIVSIISCSILLVILMFIGPYFEPLPKAVLAGIIVVALKGMLMQVKDLLTFWQLSKLDAVVWISTFLTVTIVGIDIGLLVGIIMSLISILILGMKPYTCILGSVPHTDIYLDVNRYKEVKELRDIKIFHYQGGLNFASKNYFKSELYKAIDVYPQQELLIRKKLAKITLEQEALHDNISLTKLKQKQEKIVFRSATDIKYLILDFSALSYIDPSAVTMLKLLSQEFQRIDIPMYIAGCSAPVYDTMSKCDLFNYKKKLYKIFPTVHDSVQFALLKLNSSCISVSCVISRL